MAPLEKRSVTPLTFDVNVEQLKKIEVILNQNDAGTISEAIRLAVDSFKLKKYNPKERAHRQISVRLPRKTRNFLLKLSRRKGVSVGELLRAALDSLPTKTRKGNITTTKKSTMAVKKRAKKRAAAKKRAPARKKAAKKRAPARKKAAKKRAPARKKAAKKKVAKKKAAKRKAPARKKAAKKKAVKRKAPARKKAAKKKAARKRKR